MITRVYYICICIYIYIYIHVYIIDIHTVSYSNISKRYITIFLHFLIIFEHKIYQLDQFIAVHIVFYMIHIDMYIYIHRYITTDWHFQSVLWPPIAEKIRPPWRSTIGSWSSRRRTVRCKD